MRVDVTVLGAGIVGVSTALHLQQRGADVALLDHSQPGTGASFGNAGLIERSSVIPTAFPRKPALLARYVFSKAPFVRFDPLYLLGSAPILLRYWRHSSPLNLKAAVEAMLPLLEASVDEHDALIKPAQAEHLVHSNGWIGIWRTAEKFNVIAKNIHRLNHFGLSYTVLDADQLSRTEPKIFVGPGGAVGGIHWHDPKTVTDPGELVQRYADLFARRGGRILIGNAESLRPSSGLWSARTANEEIVASNVVIALGPHSAGFARRFGYSIPILMKRGYHRHFEMKDTMPVHAVADQENGFVMSPMTRGLRLTTGIEFADLDAPLNLRQIENAEAAAKSLFSLGAAIESTPWLGIRPCPPDMRPIIGPAPKMEGLWFNFGHGHHGLTIGPATGRLLAEMLIQEKTFTDPTPYRVDRFS